MLKWTVEFFEGSGLSIADQICDEIAELGAKRRDVIDIKHVCKVGSGVIVAFQWKARPLESAGSIAATV